MRIAVVVITALLYAAGKWITGFIPTPWGVGQLLVGIFLPAYMAVVAETFPVAVGAGLGTFIGDFAVQTNPTLSLVAGVPANFIAFLFFGWFVKRYRSWPSFVAATVAFVSLGNLIAAVLVFLFAQSTIGITLPSSAIMGLTIFWNTTSIPAILIGVPILIRATRPLAGRSRILSEFPNWPSNLGGRGAGLAILFALLYAGLGAVIFIVAPDSVSSNPGIAYFALTAVLVVVFGTLSSVLAGRSTKVTAPTS